MDTLERLEEFFDDEENLGVASSAELAPILGISEQSLRSEARKRGIRRIGSTLVWSRDDALELLTDRGVIDDDDDQDDAVEDGQGEDDDEDEGDFDDDDDLDDEDEDDLDDEDDE